MTRDLSDLQVHKGKSRPFLLLSQQTRQKAIVSRVVVPVSTEDSDRSVLEFDNVIKVQMKWLRSGNGLLTPLVSYVELVYRRSSLYLRSINK